MLLTALLLTLNLVSGLLHGLTILEYVPFHATKMTGSPGLLELSTTTPAPEIAPEGPIWLRSIALAAVAIETLATIPIVLWITESHLRLLELLWHSRKLGDLLWQLWCCLLHLRG